jgi:hypothetical protein
MMWLARTLMHMDLIIGSACLRAANATSIAAAKRNPTFQVPFTVVSSQLQHAPSFMELHNQIPSVLFYTV